jgi:hypothetical protein
MAGSRVVVFVLMVGLPAWAKGKKARRKATPDGVALVFGWPDGLNADVTYRWTRSKAGKPEQALAMTARLTVARQGETVRVAFRDWNAQPMANAAPSAAAPSLEAITPSSTGKGCSFASTGRSQPTTPRGSRQALHAPGNVSPARIPGRRAEEGAQMIPALSRVQAERTWQTLVGSWTDVELKIGEDFETDVEGLMPGLPGGTLKTKLRIRAERRLDCPDDPSKRCVELKTRSEADRESMVKLRDKMGIQADGSSRRCRHSTRDGDPVVRSGILKSAALACGLSVPYS